MFENSSNFANWSHFEEIKLRGTYLSTAVDLEWMVSVCISMCFKGYEGEIKDFYKKELHELDMFQKIEVFKKGLFKYYLAFYEKYENDIGEIDRLRDLRNKFSHRQFQWDGLKEDRTKFTLNNLEKSGVVSVEYDLKESWEELSKFRETSMSFLNLVLKFMSLGQVS